MGDDGGHNKDGGFVPRVNQLDAETLDQELVTIFKNGIISSFKYFLRNPVDSFGPEVEALIRYIIWNFTLRTRYSSVGQQILNIQLNPRNRFQIRAAGFLDILMRYLQSRQSTIASMFTGYEDKIEQASTYITTVLKAAQILNFLAFLQKGEYPTLINRIFKLKPRSIAVTSRPIDSSYISRQLLWHSLTELLIFLLPFINSSQIFSRFRAPKSSSHCGLCSQLPVSRVMTACGHVYCYYCLHCSLGEGEVGACSVCRSTVNKKDIVYASNQL